MAAIRFARWAMLAGLLAASACSSSAETPPVPSSAELGARFTLGPDAPVRLDEDRLTLRLAGVPSDSRCPVDVDCVWAGEATVVVTATVANADTRLELHSPANATPDASVGDYQVRLLALHPEPRSKQPVAQSEYRVDLIVTRG
ncbi:hypothetical protein [Nocardia yamanashiensis]|uniref:hypothetical protein n=1 Tax=Nocardia yamanashiensis TaxID=209247 RepID=UPI000B21FBD8|nr:hypothetical protein [Nocardia yamanashiensis]